MRLRRAQNCKVPAPDDGQVRESGSWTLRMTRLESLPKAWNAPSSMGIPVHLKYFSEEYCSRKWRTEDDGTMECDGGREERRVATNESRRALATPVPLIASGA